MKVIESASKCENGESGLVKHRLHVCCLDVMLSLRCAGVVEAGGLSVSEARPRLPGAECHWSALATPSNFASVMLQTSKINM